MSNKAEHKEQATVNDNRTQGHNLRVLLVGEDETRDPLQMLTEQFPESTIHRISIEKLFTGEPEKGTNPRGYHYIYITDEESMANGTRLMEELPRLLSLLEENGLLRCALYGYAGYYGLAMLAEIVRGFINGYADVASPSDTKKILAVTRAVVAGLPAAHPALKQKDLIQRLEKGDKKAVKMLLSINWENIFTVNYLMAAVTQGGGCFKGWEEPGLYDLSRYVDDEQLKTTVSRIPEPGKWAAAEMIDAAPPEHRLFICAVPGQ